MSVAVRLWLQCLGLARGEKAERELHYLSELGSLALERLV